MVRDQNKDIGTATTSGISYNHLNLPHAIHVIGRGSIRYTYDAAGTKLQKQVLDTAAHPDKTTTSLYLIGFYENDTLQWLPHEEGRIRYDWTRQRFYYDFFLKDHLGNVRMMLTDQRDTAQYPAASFESASLSVEQALYDHVDRGRTARPGGFFSEASNGAWVQLLRKGTGDSLGVGKLLKIMAGDRIHIRVDYFVPAATTDNSIANGLQTAIAGLTTALNGTDAAPLLKGSGVSLTIGIADAVWGDEFYEWIDKH